MSGGVLVAGIGNVLLGDDGFGVEVAGRLATRTLPPGVRVADFGIRGVHLAYELLDGYDALVLIDAVPLAERPGTLVVLEPDAVPPADLDDMSPVLDAHSMDAQVVLGMLARLGGTVDRVVVVGCAPADLEEGIGLSPAVASAVEAAAELCMEVVAGMLPLVGKGSR
ncbi:MAG: hydrogenase maturation protease [Acidimicrobiales bacterium]